MPFTEQAGFQDLRNVLRLNRPGAGKAGSWSAARLRHLALAEGQTAMVYYFDHQEELEDEQVQAGRI